MKIKLPDANGTLSDYALQGTPISPTPLSPDSSRVVFSAAHVVADPMTANDPTETFITPYALGDCSHVEACLTVTL